MQILNDQNIGLQDFIDNIVILGKFDGIHLGHMRLIDRAKSLSSATNLPILIMNFSPHPSEFFKKQNNFQYISPIEEKIRILSELGVNYFFTKIFDQQFSEISPENFVSEYLTKLLKAKYVIVGENFSFGHKATGNTKILEEMGKKQGFDLITEKLLYLNEQQEVISSSNIREKLQNGQIAQAAKMLGRDYQLNLKLSQRKENFISALVNVNLALKSGRYSAYIRKDQKINDVEKQLFLIFSYDEEKKQALLEWQDFLEENTEISIVLKEIIE